MLRDVVMSVSWLFVLLHQPTDEKFIQPLHDGLPLQ